MLCTYFLVVKFARNAKHSLFSRIATKTNGPHIRQSKWQCLELAVNIGVKFVIKVRGSQRALSGVSASL